MLTRSITTTIALALVVLAIFSVADCQTPLRSEAGDRSPDDWFRLVVELERRADRLDRDDRAFLRSMINVLTTSQDAAPQPHQQRWLLDKIGRASCRERV